MPVFRGDAKVVDIMKAGEKVEAFIWPKSMADEKAVAIASAESKCDDSRGADIAAMYVFRMARKSDRTPLFKSAEEVLELCEAVDVEDAWQKIKAVDEELTGKADLGNP